MEDGAGDCAGGFLLLHAVALNLIALRRYDAALAHARRACELCELHEPGSAEHASSLLHMGTAHAEAGSLQLALAVFNTSLPLAAASCQSCCCSSARSAVGWAMSMEHPWLGQRR